MSATAQRRRPAARPLATALALALGLVASLVLSASAEAAGATALAWGADAAGQLGDGAARASGCQCAPAPVQVAGLAGATQIAAGPDFSLALRADGTVLAWGENEHGQLGDNTTVPSLAPVAVPGLSNVVQLAAGEEHGLALLADGTVKAWGSNGFSRLGAALGGPEQCGGVGCGKVPVTVPGVSDVVGIAAGALFDLALRADGRVVAWGEDNLGEAGDLGLSPGGISPPTLVPGVSGAMAISAGRASAYALLRDGTVKAWGPGHARFAIRP